MVMKDLYMELIKYYEILIGVEIPDRDTFKEILKLTVNPEELRLYFLLPLNGGMLDTELRTKAEKIGISGEEYDKLISRLVTECMVLGYTIAEGYSYERASVVVMSEQQVRRKGTSAKKRIYAEFFDSLIEYDDPNADIKKITPSFRTLPVESTISKDPSIGKYDVRIPVADPRAVLPIDVASEMVKAQSLIAVADCYCRAAKKEVGKDCGHLMETCFCFNDFGEALIACGTARKLELDEALDILQKCEENGLIHFVDNAEGEIRGMCNCCHCSCTVLKAMERGTRADAAASRFALSYDEQKCTHCGTCVEICQVDAIQLSDSKLTIDADKCLGCGLCVSRCVQGALKLLPRENYSRIFKTKKALNEQIFRDTSGQN